MDSQIKNRALKAMEITGGNICNRCLGRNFREIEAEDNQERGEYLRQILGADGYKRRENDPCPVCNNLFDAVEKNILIDQIIKEIKDSEIEFSTFLVGCRFPTDILRKEKEFHEKFYNKLEVEGIKKEMNREIGKKLALQLNKEVDFDNPNLVILVDFIQGGIEFQINPLFIEGRYKKLLRGIPQTKWPCRKCKGRGCEYCNYTGKMYAESVEELISKEVLITTHGKESKFHGAGREDIDVKMLGRGRPFVLEIKEPRRRTLDLKIMEKKINQYAGGKVEVLDLKLVGKKRRSTIKASSTDTYKVYRAVVELEEEVSPDGLKSLDSLEIIDQRTPLRVSHRRADKIRRRRIRKINVQELDHQKIELLIECEGGLYIKELISGDEHRTRPSVSSLLGTRARCVKLDVLDVQI